MNPHTPIIPPRPGHIGERVFADVWCRLMNSVPDDPDDNLPFVEIVGRPRLRRCKVAASFVKWLGTNCGLSLLHDCRRMAEKMQASIYHGSADAYLAAWAIENRRHTATNSGTRLLESIMSKGGTFVHWGITSLVPDTSLSADDYETVEDVVWWLGTEPGKAFVEQCEATIKELDKAHRDARAALAGLPT